MDFFSNLNLTFNEWQTTIFDLSLAGSHLLALVAGVLTLILFIRKFVERGWGIYKEKNEWRLNRLLETYRVSESEDSISQLKLLNRSERLVFRGLLQKLAEEAEGEKLKGLSKIYDAVGFADEHIRALKYANLWWKKAEAAHHLGHMMIHRARPALIKGLDDKNTEVRLEATWALGHMGFVEDLPKIVKSMSYFFKIAALRMDAFIFEMGKPALPVLLELCRHPEFEVKLLALHLVGEFKDPEALKILIPLLNSDNLECQLAACKAIGTIGEKEGLKELLPHFKDKAWQMRAQVAKQLGRHGYDEAISALKEGMEDLAWWVRHNTGEAFSTMGKKGEEALKETLNSQDRYARDMAHQWLDELEERAA